jgi:hypothetical protein
VREHNGSIELPTTESVARASRQRARDYVSSQQHPDSHCSMEGQVPGNFFVRMSLAGIEPVGFRVKSDLRNHCAIVRGCTIAQWLRRSLLGPAACEERSATAPVKFRVRHIAEI